MAKSPLFCLTDDDYESLLIFIKKGKSPASEIKRAEILLFLHNQITAAEILRLSGIGAATTFRIRKKYLTGGLKMALNDLGRTGRPKIFTPTDRAKITALACTEPPDGYARWSLSLLADRLVELKYVESISKAQVGRILKKTK